MNRLNLNKFSMEIIGIYSNNLEFINIDCFYCVYINYLEEYKIKLYNNRYCKCDAIISIDGVEVGSWRIREQESITIERPSWFYKNDSRYNGMISVTFKPEKVSQIKYKNMIKPIVDGYKYFNSTNLKSSDNILINEFSFGDTVLDKNSDNFFTPVSIITNYDTDNITELSTRLIINYKNPLLDGVLSDKILDNKHFLKKYHPPVDFETFSFDK
jgi:hypothetical protein